LTSSGNGDRRGIRYAVAVAVALFVVGVVALTLGLRGNDGPPQPVAAPAASGPASAPAAPPTTSSATSAPTGSATPTTPRAAASAAPGPAFGPFLPASAPTRIDIASIGLQSTNFVALSVAADGTLNVPGTADEVGLYDGGPTPGQLGPAVLAAHVDSKQGPGVFYRLGSVKPGAQVSIGRADGSVVTFAVDRVASYPKDQFPTDLVYRGDFNRSEIRLVTCAGAYDKSKGGYLDNVVVFGHLTKAA